MEACDLGDFHRGDDPTFAAAFQNHHGPPKKQIGCLCRTRRTLHHRRTLHLRAGHERESLEGHASLALPECGDRCTLPHGSDWRG